jgi:hypothetical protein
MKKRHLFFNWQEVQRTAQPIIEVALHYLINPVNNFFKVRLFHMYISDAAPLFQVTENLHGLNGTPVALDGQLAAVMPGDQEIPLPF